MLFPIFQPIFISSVISKAVRVPAASEVNIKLRGVSFMPEMRHTAAADALTKRLNVFVLFTMIISSQILYKYTVQCKTVSLGKEGAFLNKIILT